MFCTDEQARNIIENMNRQHELFKNRPKRKDYKNDLDSFQHQTKTCDKEIKQENKKWV